MNKQRLQELAGIKIDESSVRKWTVLIQDAMDQGAMDPRGVADAALAYMSEAEVEDMARANDWKEMLDPGYYDEDQEY